MAQFNRQLKSANTSERAAIADKIRGLTPGADVLIASLGLEEAQ